MADEMRTLDKALRPRARLLVLLGDQLIRDANMAVFEMVKNAYDADARECLVQLQAIDGQNQELASITVLDDGVGMSFETVKDHWLEPGTDRRTRQKARGERTGLGRLPLGEKGVGRFAAHKLGRQISLITRASGCPEVVVEVDWDRFDPVEQPEGAGPLYLDQVPIRVEERKPRHFKGAKTGTVIRVSGLRELPWTRRAVRALHRSITSITQPFENDSSFQTILVVEPDRGWLDDLLDAEEIVEHAPFHFQCTLHGTEMKYRYEFVPGPKLERKGVTPRSRDVAGFPIFWTPTADEKKERYDELVELPSERRNDLPKRLRKKGILVDLEEHGLGEVEIRLDLFDLDTKVINLTLGNPQTLRSYLDENGGVRVYRDGIRVFDFGEPGNDWLDLEGRRVNTPTARIGNNQVLGAVFLTTEGSAPLVEKTNREGFVENDAYRALRDAVGCAIVQAAAERNEDKDRLRRALQGPRDRSRVIDALEEIRGKLRTRDLEQEFDPVLRRVEHEYGQFRDSMLFAAGTGLNLAAVIHQVEKDIKYLDKLVEADEDRAKIEEVVKRLGQMTDTAHWLMSESGTGQAKASDLIGQSLRTWRFRFQYHGIEVLNGFTLNPPCPDFERTMSRKLVSTALMNLLDNAIYWLGTRAEDRRIYTGTSVDLADGPAIVVADNGPGLQDDDPEMLIQPFYTRKPGGTGLGLHIADEVMKQQPGGGGVRFPEAGDVALPDGFNGACVALVWEE